MNRPSKLKLGKLVEQCEAALRDKHQQSVTIWRGEMWAIIAAAHELRKRGILPARESAMSADAVDPIAADPGKLTTRERKETTND